MHVTTTGGPRTLQRVKLPYLPALDGLRGLALVSILLMHAGVDTVKGGHFALTAFFTLSGFLITALLLIERHQTGTVDLKQFWTRRARRLVPALLLCFPLVALVVLVSGNTPSEGLLLDAVAAATWVANWRFILAEQQYADLFALPSPFQHFWSLAVEEQFYLVFPVVLLLVLGVGSARARTGRLAALLLLLTALSTWQLVRLYGDGGSLGRAYYGTDARLAELLVGALLALAFVGPAGLRTLPRWLKHVVSAAGTAGLGVLVLLTLTVDEDAHLTYRGGFLLAAVCTAAVVSAGLQPRSPVALLLSWRPLVWLGMLSYGVYLFHWPLFQLLTERWTGLDESSLLALRLASVVLLAWASYALLERPVRTGNLPTAPAFGGWATGTVAGVVVVAAAFTAVTFPQAVPTQEVLASSDETAGVIGSEALREPTTIAPEASEPMPPPGTSTPDAAVQAGAAPGRSAPTTTPSARATTTGSARSAPATGGAPAALQAPPPSAPSERPVEQEPPAMLAPEHKDPVPTLPARKPGALRVAIVGDSISANLGTGLQRWSRDRSDMQVVVFSMGGCPLALGGDRRVTPGNRFEIDPECNWWSNPSSKRSVRFKEWQPHLVLIDAGIDEVFDRRLDEWGDWRQPGHPQFDQWLVGQYRSAVQLWSDGGAKVILGDTPCADWQRFEPFREMENGDLRVQAVNLAYTRVTGVERLGLHERVCPNGQYTDDVEGVEGGRFDGFHFTEPAQDALARNWLGPLLLQSGAGLAG